MSTLYEEFTLLSIHEDKGIFIRSYSERIKTGLVGAVLAELALLGKIKITKNRRLQLVDEGQINDLILDEAVVIIKGADKEHKLSYWIHSLGQKTEKLQRQIIESLIQKGILDQTDDHISWVVPSPLHAESNASAKYWSVNRLRGVVLAHSEYQPSDIALLSLISAGGLLELVFLRDERKLAERTISELVLSEAMKNPAIETIQEIAEAVTAEVEED